MSTATRPTAAARLDTLITRIEAWKSLDRVAQPLAEAAGAVLSQPRVRDLLSGTMIGHPAHPLLVAVPIGAWSSALIFDLTGRTDGATKLVGIGLLGAVPTALTGISDWRYTSGAERRVGLVHASLNVLATSAYGISWWLRRQSRHRAGLLWAVVGATSLGAAGWLGGHLAYGLGVGVDTTAFQHADAEWTDVAAAADVRTGELLGVRLDDTSLVLTRSRQGEIIALADRCTHRGGPLHEGALDDGCLVCPWHGSRFALDGRVVSGPATRPQPRYSVRVALDRVLVRRAGEERALRLNPVGH